jgi:hypothetical protein
MNFREKLRKQLEQTAKPPASVNIYERLARARSTIHRAFNQAQGELERYGYFLAVVRDTGSMISAKVFAPNLDRDFNTALTAEEGFPINLQLSADDERGVAIYSYRHLRGSVTIAQSMKVKELEDGIYKEIGEQVIAAIEFWKAKKS